MEGRFFRQIPLQRLHKHRTEKREARLSSYTYKNVKNSFSHINYRGYNTQFLLLGSLTDVKAVAKRHVYKDRRNLSNLFCFNIHVAKRRASHHVNERQRFKICCFLLNLL